jgi:hypothetical protein
MFCIYAYKVFEENPNMLQYKLEHACGYSLAFCVRAGYRSEERASVVTSTVKFSTTGCGLLYPTVL